MGIAFEDALPWRVSRDKAVSAQKKSCFKTPPQIKFLVHRLRQ